MNKELLTIPRDLLENLLENTIVLQAENHWKRSETKRGYNLEYQRWSKQIQEVENILRIKTDKFPIYFREQRGSLEESMKTVREFTNLKDLELFIHQQYGDGVVTISPHSWDERFDRDTYIVCLNGEACGFTNGNF